MSCVSLKPHHSVLCVSDGRQDTRQRGIGEGRGLEVCLWTMKGFAFKEAGFILTHFQGTVHH